MCRYGCGRWSPGRWHKEGARARASRRWRRSSPAGPRLGGVEHGDGVLRWRWLGLQPLVHVDECLRVDEVVDRVGALGLVRRADAEPHIERTAARAGVA